MQFPALYNGCDVQMADSEYEWDIPMDANTLKRGVPVACFLRIRTWEFTTREGKQEKRVAFILLKIYALKYIKKALSAEKQAPKRNINWDQVDKEENTLSKGQRTD